MGIHFVSDRPIFPTAATPTTTTPNNDNDNNNNNNNKAMYKAHSFPFQRWRRKKTGCRK